MKLQMIDIRIHEEKLKIRTQPTLVNPIKIYLNFLYYLGASPFRCVSDFDRNGCIYYHKTVSRPQQVICAFLHILCIFRLVSQIRDVLSMHSAGVVRSATPYFSLVDEVCSFLFKAVTIKRLWFNADDYLRIMNTIANDEYLSIHQQWILKPWVLYVFYGFVTVKVFARFVVSTGFPSLLLKWTFSDWMCRLIDQAQFVFCFHEQSTSVRQLDFKPITIGSGILAFLMMCTHYIRLIFSEFCDLFIFAFASMLWSVTNSFYNEINENLNTYYMHDKTHTLSVLIHVEPKKKDQQTAHVCQYWESIYKRFQSIQILAEVINIGAGSQVGWYLAEGLMYYSIYLNVMLLTSDLFVKFSNMTFFFVTFTTLYISADICTQMTAAKVWLVKRSNIKLVPLEEAHIILHETILKDIGIRGNNVFTITFPFVAAYLSLIVTFFIICVQEGHSKTT